MLKKPKGSPFCILASFAFLARDRFNFLSLSEFIFFKYISTKIIFSKLFEFFRYTRIILRFTKEEKNEAKVRKQAKPIRPSTKLLGVSTLLCEFFFKKKPRSCFNKPGTAKVCAISKAQK